MENDATEPGSGGVEPPDSVESAVEEPIPTYSQADLDKAENLIRQAALARRRNETGNARRLMDEAEATAPGSAVVLEALGDLLMEQSKWSGAKDKYEKALKIEPENVGIERKYGECVFHLYTAGDFLSRPQDSSFVGGKAAIILSLFVPGLGQFAAEQYQRGAIMMGGWAIGWGLAWLIPDGMKGLFSALGLSGRGAQAAFNPLVLLPLGVAVIFHLWSIMDAASKAGNYRAAKIDRPTPPVDKDFEI